MKHEQFLLELLKPLGVYDLNHGTLNRAELTAYAKVLDQLFEKLEGICRESFLTIADGKGLELIRELLPYRPASGSPEELRQALSALLRIGGDSFTLNAINDTLSGCGISAATAEGNSPGYVEVNFPGVKGVPPAFEELRAIVEEILPCHLEVTYLFWYNNWAVLGEMLPTFGDVEASGLSWYKLSVLKE